MIVWRYRTYASQDLSSNISLGDIRWIFFSFLFEYKGVAENERNANLFWIFKKESYTKHMKKNILVVVWHPRSWSFCGALAEWYISWATNAGNEVRKIFLSDYTHINYNLIEWENTGESEDLIWATRRKDVIRADHLLFVFPTRRYSAPACLKGWFDRLLLPKFSHQYTWFLKRKRLLGWRTASIISTCWWPWYTYLATFWHPWIRRLKWTLWFVWITPRKSKLFTKLAPGLRTQTELSWMICISHRLWEKAW